MLYPKDPVPIHAHAHLQPNPLIIHSQSYDNNINIRPISFGLSDAIEHIPASSPRAPGPSPLGQQDSTAPRPRPPLPKRLTSNFFANFSSHKNTPKLSLNVVEKEKEKPKPKVKPGFTPFAPEELREARDLRDMGWNRPGDRVTVQFPMAKTDDGSPAPMLQLRFSALDMPSPSQMIAALSLRTNTENGTDAPTNAAYQGSHHDLEHGTAEGGNTRRRSSLFGALGIGGLARAVQTRVQTTLPRSVGSSRLSSWLGQVPAGTRTSTPPIMQSTVQPEISQIPRPSQRHSLGLGVVDGGRSVALADPRSLQVQPTESDAGLAVPGPRFSGAQHHAAQRPSQASSLSYATTASDVGQTTPMAEIVQARTVHVSTQMSTLLYSPQMSAIVGAQILHDSPSSSQRRKLAVDTPPGSSSGSPSPRKRPSEMLSASPANGAAGASLSRMAAGNSRTAARHRMRQATMASVQSVETAYSNEEGDYFSHRPQTLDVMGARVRVRTPTIVTSDTRRSVPLEHCWTPSVAEEQVVEERQEGHDDSPLSGQTLSEQSSVRVLQQEFLRYEHNFHQGTSVRGVGTEDGTTTCTVPPAYENHRHDELAMNDRDAGPRHIPPVVRARVDSGVLGGLGDPL